VPEVVLDHPEVVLGLHREFAHAGSDVVLAFTYYGHREKMRLVGKEHLLEPLNREALALARTAADEYGCLVAGNVCNTNHWGPDDPQSQREVRQMFDEQIGWAAEAGVDYIVSETNDYYGEAATALEAIRAHGLPSVVTLSAHRDPTLWDGVPLIEAAKRLEQAGADAVGLNCMRGPATILPLLEELRAAVSCPVAALPVPYRTDPDHPTFQSLEDPGCGCLPTDRPFPTALDPFTCNRYELGAFARDCWDMGVRYIGVCCGGAPHHVRAMAEAWGRRPAASRYAPDMSRHAFLGTAGSSSTDVAARNRAHAEQL
jgi:betaine-homocysteine S-methyltransferase